MPERHAVDLCEHIALVGWPSRDAQVAAVMEHISSPAEIRLSAQAARTMLQDYTSIQNHLPARIWSGPKEQFAHELCELCCVDLGLQNASEPTVQIVAFVVLVTEGRSGAMTSSWEHKRSMVDVVKNVETTSVPEPRRMGQRIA